MNFEKWHVLAVGVLFLILAGSIFLTSEPRVAVSGPEVLVRELLAPIQGAVSAFAQTVTDGVHSLTSIGRLQEENRNLRQQLAALRAELRSADQYRRENIRLRELLKLDQRLARPTVTARVIARSAENWFGTVTLNRGSRAGIAPGLPVINADGVVGQVVNVTPNTARVILMVDSKSAVGGVVLGSDTPVLVEGTSDPTGSEARVRPLVRDARLEPGSLVVTAGSSVFPKGIPIGTIVDVQRDPTGMNSRATLSPRVDFGRLEWVTVLLENDGEVAWNGTAADPEEAADDPDPTPDPEAIP